MAHEMVFTLQPRDPPTFGNLQFWTADYGAFTYTVVEDAGTFTASARRPNGDAVLLAEPKLSYDEAVRLCRTHAAHTTGALP